MDAGKTFDVSSAVAEILAQPVRFEHAEIDLASLSSQIRGRSKLTFHYVAAMTRANARRPLLLARQSDGSLILLDGRHRAARSLQLGYVQAAAWILSPDQLSKFSR
ncbi:hypothetical protein [Methylocystis heyeri]|uniref:ParB/Sulfiredoxin domain-containing protein n=1 Tax=Methylocystis heyeri TaxID=391905 RepID=A0A6B8KEH2_9HYPH|nr:hypothetical protein [Methylocystis heyeri]QGM46864.1 hypothetical protein H2LOC_014830 [Methylocystis heyeri]